MTSRAEIVDYCRWQIPRWQGWDEAHQQTIWTAGQVVADFRKHGMPPPGYGFFEGRPAGIVKGEAPLTAGGPGA